MPRPPRIPHKAVRQSLVLEASVKLTVNLLLTVIAGATMAKLVPHYRTQQADLELQQSAVEALQADKAALWHDFSRNFDPQQASQVMQAQSGREKANQWPVVWVDPLQTQHP